MASSYTTNKNIEKPASGDYPGAWAAPINANWDLIDSALGATLSLALTNVNVTLSRVQAGNLIIKLTGTLTGNVQITFPAYGGFWVVSNETTGSFTVTIACAGGGTTITAAQSARTIVMTDGTNARIADDRVVPSTVAGPPTGEISMYGGSTAPTGWLECDGAAISRTTYAALFTAISTNYGVGNGSTTFNVPDFRGYFARGWDHGRGIDTGRALGTTQTGNVGTHTHSGTTASNGDHTHNVTNAACGLGGGAYSNRPSSFASTGPTPGTDTAGAHTHTFTTDNGTQTGETRPVNLSVMFIIKT